MHSEEPRRSASDETVLGLNAREVMAFGLASSVSPEFLRHWTPPTAGELGRQFPQWDSFSWVARGGMGAVYRAHDSVHARWVAIKLLPVEGAGMNSLAERFRSEANALARLQHPNVVAIYETGQTSAGHPFLVMEYVAGGTLADLMAGGRIESGRAVDIAVAIGNALECAHYAGIVHRDLKPSNILMTEAGEPKLVDFGLAHIAGELSQSDSRLTRAGAALGTPDYMAPEQRTGRAADGRADIFALGVVLYEMLTGELPRGAWRAPLFRGQPHPAMDAILQKALQHDPDRRFSSVADFNSRLQRAAAMPPANQRRRILLGGFTVLTGAAGSGWWVRNARSSRAQPPTSETSPSAPALSPPGTYLPLDTLDLPSAAVTGHWHWQDDVAHDVLCVAYTHEQLSLKILKLPVYPGPRSYDLQCDLWLDHRGSSLIFMIPAGHVRPALVMDFYDYSGLEFVRKADWKTNATSVAKELPTGRFLPLSLRVRPKADVVSIEVTLEGTPFLAWTGPQSDLSLQELHYPQAYLSLDGTGLVLYSQFGGARLRSMRVEIHD